ncbi:MAG TPA: DUF4397 domain-containing protein, partial [Minicystis sp.]|nr:DUF4397 domain-containing protein [Minicystis sp.]
GSGGGDSTGSMQHPDDKKAHVRLVHAAPDAPSVDVYPAGGDTPLVAGLSYGDTSAYLDLAPGTYELELRASPSTSKDPVAYTTDAMVMRAGEKLTAIAAGVFGSSNDGDKFRVLPFEEQFGPPGSGSAMVRVVHCGADAPTVSLDLDDDDPSAPEITGLDRFTDSGAAGFPLTSGRADAIGVVVGGQKLTSFTTPDLPDGADLFVIATGLTKKLARQSDGFALLAVGPDGTIGFVKQDPVVYALHASPDAPAVDAFVGDAKLVDGVSFGRLAAPVQVRPGTYTLDFFAHQDGGARPASPPAASASTGTLEPGQRYLAIATGLLAAPSGLPGFQLAAYAEDFALDDASSGRIRVVHASPDAPAVDVGILNVEKTVSPVLVSDLSFGQASDGAGLSSSAGTVPFGVAPAGSDTTVVAALHVPVAAGMRAFGVAAGALDASHGQSFRLLAVDTTTTPWSVATVMPQPMN